MITLEGYLQFVIFQAIIAAYVVMNRVYNLNHG